MDTTFGIERSSLLRDVNKSSSLNSQDEFQGNGIAQTNLFQRLAPSISEGTVFYNTFVLAIFNISLAQFGFPYLIYRNGFLIFVITLLLNAFVSYFLQLYLIKILSTEKMNLSNMTLIKLISKHLGKITGILTMLCILVWFSNILIIQYMLVYKFVVSLIDYEYKYALSGMIVSLVTFFINLSNNHKMIYGGLIFGVITNIVTLVSTLTQFSGKIHNKKNYDVDFFKFGNSIFDIINLNSNTFGTVFIYFWVSLKISESKKIENNKSIIISSLVYDLIYYTIFFISEGIFIDPNFFNDSLFLIYRKLDSKKLNFPLIIMHSMNIINQTFQVNFFFLIIKSVIVPEEVSKYLKGRKYVLISVFYITIIAFIGYFFTIIKIDPYYLMMIVNGAIGFFSNILIPGIIYIKLTKDKLLSFKSFTYIGFIFLYCVCLLTSFYKNIFEIVKS